MTVKTNKANAKKTAKKITPKKTAPKRATTAKAKGPTGKNLDIYGAAPIPWSRALKQLEAGAGGTYWLATTNPDGRPHLAAVGALWVDGKVYFTSGTRKGRNLAANPECVLSVSLTGIDLVVEGTAVRITDRPTLLRLAKRYAAQGWPANVSGGALTAEYSAPTSRSSRSSSTKVLVVSSVCRPADGDAVVMATCASPAVLRDLVEQLAWRSCGDIPGGLFLDSCCVEPHPRVGVRKHWSYEHD